MPDCLTYTLMPSSPTLKNARFIVKESGCATLREYQWRFSILKDIEMAAFSATSPQLPWKWNI